MKMETITSRKGNLMTTLSRSKKAITALILSVWLLLCFASSALALDDIFYFNMYRRISMEFEEASLKDVLKVISQQANLNFVAAEDVEDIALTLYLDNVTVKEALDNILSANNLIYEFDPESKIFTVKRSFLPAIETITKIFHLKFAPVPGSPLHKAIAAGGEGAGAEGGASIVTIIGNLLTEYGKIDVDTRTNSLIITDVAERFGVIEEVIVKLDTPLPQVMIEVEMLDVSKDAVDKLGVQWPENILKLDVTGERVTSFPFTGKHKTKTSGALWEELESPGGADLSGWTATDFAPTILKVINAELALNFLKTQTDTKFLARPRILTLSNETAEIKIITDEAIGIQTTTTSAEGTGTSATAAERSETGVILKVTPQVDIASGEITMFIEPIVSEAKRSALSADFRDPEVRSTKSTLRIKDGQTLMIGGLIRSEEDSTKTKVPFLSNIPLLGMLFRHKDKTVTDRELVVFITPHILEDSITALAKSQDSSELTFDSDVGEDLSARESEVERLLRQYEIE